MRCRVAILAGLLVSSLAPTVATVAAQDSSTPIAASPGVTLLTPGQHLELEVPGNQALVFGIDAEPGSYLELWATRAYGDLRLVLDQPDGTNAVELEDEFDGLAGLRLVFVTTGVGRHILRITTHPVDEPRSSTLELTFHAARAAEPRDAARAELFARLAAARAAWRRAEKDDDRRAALVQLRTLPGEFTALAAPDGAAYAWGLVLDETLALGDTAGAREAADAALAACRAAGLRREEGRALSDVGLAAYTAFDKSAIDAYTAALEIHEEVGDTPAVTSTLRRIGWYWRWQGDRHRALEFYERALPLCVATRDWQGEIGALGDVGLAQMELGEVDSALANYERALALTVPGRDEARIASLLGRMGPIYNLAGEYDRAIAISRQAIAAAAAVRDRRGEATAYHNLGLVLVNVGDHEGAAESYQHALELAREMQLKNGIAASLLGLSTCSRGMGDLAAAERFAREALEAARESGSAMEHARALRRLSTFALERGDPAAAAVHATAARELAANGNLRTIEAGALIDLASAHGVEGSVEKAVALSSEALELVRALGAAPELESQALGHRARWKLVAGDRAGARADIERAVELIESVRRRFIHQDRRTSYRASRQQLYELQIEALLAGGDSRPEADAAAAFEVAERARARSLLETLAESRVDLRSGVDPDLLARERALRRRVNYKASDLDRLLEGKVDRARFDRLGQELDSLTVQLKDLEAEIRASSPHYAELTQPEPRTAEMVRKQVLDDDTVLLEFALGERRSWLWAVTRTEVAVFELPPRSVLEPLARAVYDAATARQADPSARRMPLARADRELQTKSAEISRLLFGPIAEQLSGAWKRKRLAMVAPDALGVLPFAALPSPTAGRELRLLIADHELVLLPSASVLAEVRRHVAGRAVSPKTIAVLADPVFEADDPRVTATASRRAAPAVGESRLRSRFSRLLFSREEARAIGEVVPRGQLLQLTGFDADVDRVTRGELANFRILHFATHGLLHTERPELSGLALSLYGRDGRPRNGFLRLNELYNLRLSADLTVLSACQTALGREIRGEGLVGLTRSFMYAGVPRVVATLWKIDDAATAELMRAFYRALLKEGRGPAAALRAAQLELARTPAWSAPYYWAGFVLQGDWSGMPTAR